jgi:ferric-dicitrate binding protein FerR (iron transport regulator)
MRRASNGVVLDAGMVGEVAGDSIAEVRTVKDVTAYTTWISGRLTFHQARVSDVLRALGQWYGYDFRVADSALTSMRVTTSFKSGTPDETLRALADLLDVFVTIDGTRGELTVVTLRPTIASRPAPPRPRRERDTFSPSSKEFGR